MVSKIKIFINKLTNGEYIPVDKMLHFSISYIIASFFLTPLISISAVVGANILKETYDKYIKKSKFDITDIIAGLLGGAFYILLQYLKQ